MRVGGQIPVGDLRPGRPRDRPVAHAQVGDGRAQLARRRGQQDLACLRAREAQRGAALLDGETAGGLTLVRRTRGVAVDDVDPLEVDVELVGGDLGQCGADALAQLDLAGEDRHGAVGIDPQPGVETAVAVEAARQRRGFSAHAARSEREGDHEAAGCEELAARRPHGRISAAAFCTARTMRLCEAQRQRWPLRAARTSRSLGFGLRSSRALAAMTMPLPQ